MIDSLDNKKIKELAKLKQKKYRDLTNTYLIEGIHLIDEAYKEGVLESIVITEDYNYEVPKLLVSPSVMKKLSSLDTENKIIGVCKKRESNNYIGNILILDSIQDPGNLGTIIRSAVAFNIKTIILGLGTVDLYNDKVLRATEGMIYHLNIIKKDLNVAICELKDMGYIIYGTNVKNGTNLDDIKPKSKYAFIVGNEGAGVKKEILDLCDEYLYIPMNKECESLNVSIATSIILYTLGDNHE